jgi:hypothetical protein
MPNPTLSSFHVAVLAFALFGCGARGPVPQPGPAPAGPITAPGAGAAPSPTTEARLATFAERSEAASRRMVLTWDTQARFVGAPPLDEVERLARDRAMLEARCAEVGDAVAGDQANAHDRPELVCPAVGRIGANVRRDVVGGRAKRVDDELTSFAEDGTILVDTYACFLDHVACASASMATLRTRLAPMPDVLATITAADIELSAAQRDAFSVARAAAATRPYRTSSMQKLTTKPIVAIAKQLAAADGLHTFVAIIGGEIDEDETRRELETEIVVRRDGEPWCRAYARIFQSTRSTGGGWSAWEVMALRAATAGEEADRDPMLGLSKSSDDWVRIVGCK